MIRSDAARNHNERKTLVGTVHLLPFIGYPRALNAVRVINQGTAP